MLRAVFRSAINHRFPSQSFRILRLNRCHSAVVSSKKQPIASPTTNDSLLIRKQNNENSQIAIIPNKLDHVFPKARTDFEFYSHLYNLKNSLTSSLLLDNIHAYNYIQDRGFKISFTRKDNDTKAYKSYIQSMEDNGQPTVLLNLLQVKFTFNSSYFSIHVFRKIMDFFKDRSNINKNSTKQYKQFPDNSLYFPLIIIPIGVSKIKLKNTRFAKSQPPPPNLAFSVWVKLDHIDYLNLTLEGTIMDWTLGENLLSFYQLMSHWRRNNKIDPNRKFILYSKNKTQLKFLSLDEDHFDFEFDFNHPNLSYDFYLTDFNIYHSKIFQKINRFLQDSPPKIGDDSLLSNKMKSIFLFKKFNNLKQNHTINKFNSLKHVRNEKLDDLQKIAVLSSVNCYLTIINGPPGTGKSSIIFDIINELLLNDNNKNMIIILIFFIFTPNYYKKLLNFVFL